jgi:hypothetical protein
MSNKNKQEFIKTFNLVTESTISEGMIISNSMKSILKRINK